MNGVTSSECLEKKSEESPLLEKIMLPFLSLPSFSCQLCFVLLAFAPQRGIEYGLCLFLLPSTDGS